MQYIEKCLVKYLQSRHNQDILLRTSNGKESPFRHDKRDLAMILSITTDELQPIIEHLYSEGYITRDDGQFIDFTKQYIWQISAKGLA